MVKDRKQLTQMTVKWAPLIFWIRRELLWEDYWREA